MSTHHISPPHQQFHRDTASPNADSPKNNSTAPYPPATASYDDVVRDGDLFWEKLRAFHKSSGNKFKVPTVGGNALDLHRLFVEVTSRGGIEKVIRDRKWKEVIGAFKFPTTITSASFVLRKYYLSLLYDFEQVYYFRKQFSPLSTADDKLQRMVNESVILDEGNPELHVGCSVIGAIDGKFDNGYLVTVRFGSEELKGVLYHVPPVPYGSCSSYTSTLPPRKHWKRSRLALRDPSRPKSNRSGYNFFFAEHYTRLKPHYHGQERIISKKIGNLWNNLTEAEKQVGTTSLQAKLAKSAFTWIMLANSPIGFIRRRD
ncbi:high mobility group B protein 10 isoform X2 [Carica papaya]|uniref:high mobility group B protein 10 isoform X2 n=1 Tax=Carica papaya TaxID=3649 RepID=UPI000B8CA3D1|nr:high mobility group B protein 10 isoform X2 [Carica papaya]